MLNSKWLKLRLLKLKLCKFNIQIFHIFPTGSSMSVFWGRRFVFIELVKSMSVLEDEWRKKNVKSKANERTMCSGWVEGKQSCGLWRTSGGQVDGVLLAGRTRH